MTQPGRAAGQATSDDRPTPEVVRSLVDNTQLLIKKEIELAKLEIKELIVARVFAAVFALVAGILGLYLLAFLGVTVAKVLELWFAPWLAWLIVSGAILLLILVLVLLAWRKLRSPPWAPVRTKETLEETATWAKQQLGASTQAGEDRV